MDGDRGKPLHAGAGADVRDVDEALVVLGQPLLGLVVGHRIDLGIVHQQVGDQPGRHAGDGAAHGGDFLGSAIVVVHLQAVPRIACGPSGGRGPQNRQPAGAVDLLLELRVIDLHHAVAPALRGS
jgi:hypothetical protein